MCRPHVSRSCSYNNKSLGNAFTHKAYRFLRLNRVLRLTILNYAQPGVKSKLKVGRAVEVGVARGREWG